MEAALQALLDKQAILELVNTYCRAADRHDHELMRSLYHEDATDDHGAFFKGLAMDFIDRLPDIQAPMNILHHNVTTTNIVVDGHQAEGEIYILAFHQVQTADGPIDLLIGGRYLDRYEKRQGVWKFLHRAVLADWANVHNPTLVNLDNPMIEGAHIGQPGKGDPSYAFFQKLR
ncbi:MAG: nuclear transport factor 2 family protein [Gammaproteobacteria bacterium]|nr:MAG: nuclear transport factor 2 family protein [Gammaproteobacteria bacterium]